jgi:hypothetical protein
MLWAYFDESGEHDLKSSRLTRLILGGCLAPSESWDVLNDRWQTALNLVGVNTFHMVDFEHDRGEFKNWKEDRPEDRERLINELLSLIVAHVPSLVGFISYPAAVRRAFKKTYRKGIVDSMVHLAREARSGDEGAIAIVYAKQPQYPTSKIEEHYGEIGCDDPRLRTFAVQEPLGIPALQAADIVAYEMTHKMQSSQPEREYFHRLKIGVRQFSVFDRGAETWDEEA